MMNVGESKKVWIFLSMFLFSERFGLAKGGEVHIILSTGAGVNVWPLNLG